MTDDNTARVKNTSPQPTMRGTIRKLVMAENLADALLTGDPACMSTGCVSHERQRALTAPERKRGWKVRPFWAYDPARMCRPCAAYWHATQAATLLRDHERDQNS